MIESIKITSLNDIGSNLTPNSLFPVVDVSGTPITDKANLQIIGNVILSGAGGSSFVQAAQATLAQSVTNAAQPNITSVGTLNINTLHISGGTDGYFLQTDGTGNLSWSAAGSGNGSPGGSNREIQYNDNGVFGGNSKLTWDNANGIFTAGELVVEGTYGHEVVLTAKDGPNSVIFIATDGISGNSGLVVPGSNLNYPTTLAGGDYGLVLIGTNQNTSMVFTSSNVGIGVNSNVWLFDGTGNLILPTNTSSINYANGHPYGGSGNANTGNIIFNNTTLTTPNTVSNTAITIAPHGTNVPGWYSLYGDLGSRVDDNYGEGVAYDPSGNIYVVGGDGNYGIVSFLIKYDPSGTLLWQKTFAIGSDYKSGEAVVTDSTGNVYAAIHDYVNQYQYIVKLDTNGNILWQKEIQLPSNSNTGNMAIDSSGNLYAVAYDNTNRTYLFKFDPSGTLLWQKMHTASAGVEAGGVAVDNTGNVYTGSGYNTVSTVKYDSSGNVLNQFLAPEIDPLDIAIDTSGNLYLAGRSEPGGLLAIQKLDSSGNSVWLSTINTTNSALGTQFDPLTNSIFVTLIVNSKIVIVALNATTGAIRWSNQFGSGRENQYYYYGTQFIAVYGTTIAVTGYSNQSGPAEAITLVVPSDGTSLGNYGNYTYSAITLTATVTSGSTTAGTDTIQASSVVVGPGALTISNNNFTYDTVPFAYYPTNFVFDPSGNLTIPGTLTSGGVISTGNVTGGNIVSNGNVTAANYFVGDGGHLSNINHSNISGLGSIVTVNLDSNVSNILSGTGAWVPIPTANTGNITFNYATMASDSPNYDVLVKGYGTTANVNLESYNDVNITARVVPAKMTSVAVNSSGLFVAVGSSQGYPAYATSTDGINWTAAEPIPAPTTMYGIVITAITVDSSGFFVAVGYEQYGYPVYTTSSDGTNWSTIAFITQNIVFSPLSIAISVNSGLRFTAVGVGSTYQPTYASSGDGVNWLAYGYMNNSTAFGYINSVTVNSAGLFVAVGYNGDLYPIYATSPDGYNWTTPATMNGSTTEALMQSVTVNSAGLFVAVGRDGAQNAIYATSPDGTNWTTPALMSGSPVSGFMTSVTVNSAGLFVAVGYDYNNNKHPLYATSTDGSTWTAPALMNGSTINAYMSSVTVNSSGLFVAVGYDTYDTPLYAYSTNGSNWTTPATTAFTQQVNINANEQSWTFSSDGTLTAPGNVNMLGTRINIGPGSNVIPLTAPVLVATNANAQFIQTVLVNADVTGSSDYAAQGPDSDDTQGYVDLGFAGSAFNDANFSITQPGDGYLFAQGFSGGIGGNLVLSTGDKGTGQDIVFSMGGFLANNEFARMSLSNNAFELVQMDSAIQSRHSDALTIQTPTVSVSSNQAKWDYAVPTLQNAKGQWQGTGTSADGVTLYTLQSDIDPTVALFYTDYLHTTPYILPSQLFGAVGDFLYGTKANDLYIKGGPAVSTTRGLGGDIILSASDGVETQWRFTTHGEFFAPGNAYLTGNLITVGPNANVFANSLQNATLVISDGDSAYVQAAITNASDTGSADWVAYGHHGNTDSGWIDTGFTSAGYNDANYTITSGGDGYIFVEGYQLGQAPFQGGGNLVLATGNFGANRDILFATNGFSTTNLFGKISDANNALELIRAGASIVLPNGGVIAETSIPTGGLSGSTIALTPAGGTNANQQLLVYPTIGADNNHLHLTSGNLYNTELYLGDDNLYVKLANTGNIIINSNNGIGNSAQWNFGTNGTLTLPDGSGVAGGFIYGAPGSAGGVTNGGTGYQQFFAQSDGAYVQTSVGDAGVTFNSWIFGLDGNLTVPGGITGATQVTANSFQSNGAGGNITMTGGNITGANAVSANTIVFSDNTTQTTAYQTVKSGFNAQYPSITLDNVRAAINNAGNPTVGAVSGTWSGPYTAQVQLWSGTNYPLTTVGSNNATWTSVASYGIGVTFANPGDQVVGYFTSNDAGHIYKITWIATASGPSTGYGFIQIEKII